MANRPPRIPEKVVQQHIVTTLTRVGGRVWVLGTRRPSGDYQGTRQTPGIPDLVAFLPPKGARASSVLLFVECKAKGGRLRPEQQVFRDLCVGAEVAHVVGDLDAVIAWLLTEGYLKRDQIPHYRMPAAEASA